MIVDTDEGSMRSDYLENKYKYDDIINLKSTDSDNIQGSNNSLHQYDRMILLSRVKKRGNITREKPLNSRQFRAAKQLAMSALEMVYNYIYTVGL